MRDLRPVVLALADAGGGRVSRRDLTANGVSKYEIGLCLQAGIFQSVGWGEYRVAGSGLTFEQELASRLWRCGDSARVAGPLACRLYGLTGFLHVEDDHIAVPPGRRVRGVDFKVIRTPIARRDMARIGDLPGVTAARGLVGASAEYAPARIRVAHDDALHKGLVERGEFAEVAASLGNAYGAAAARRIARGGALDSESEPERDLFSIFRRGDPRPERQVWVCWHGKWFRLDYAYREVRIDLEYDGKDHESTRERDADRDLALAELDIQALRVTAAMMRSPEDTRRRILAVYQRRQSQGLAPIPYGLPPWEAAKRGRSSACSSGKSSAPQGQ